ncbi:MAG: peptidoglycan-binding domain-containing protein [Acidimicrobiales bacterium]|jgi:hypothetical protein
MPKDPAPYVVRDGDHIEGVAHRFGVDADDIRQEPKNADIVTLRGDLSMLIAGDILYITSPDPSWSSLTAGSSNTFTTPVSTVDVHIKLCDDAGPIAGASYTVEGVDPTVSDATGADGLVKFTVPVTVRSVLLTLAHAARDSGDQASSADEDGAPSSNGPPPSAQTFDVHIGGLDPIEETSGVKMRLSHLGFFSGPIDPDNDEHLQWAVKAFQSSKNLDASGELDDVRSHLRAAHGS